MGTGKDTREMGKDDNSKTRVKRLRWFALGLPGRSCFIVGGVSGRLADQRDVQRAGRNLLGGFKACGQRGFGVEPPAEPIFRLAKERGYLGTGHGPAGTAALIKQVPAVGGTG
jgi:hypothetical protein